MVVAVLWGLVCVGLPKSPVALLTSSPVSSVNGKVSVHVVVTIVFNLASIIAIRPFTVRTVTSSLVTLRATRTIAVCARCWFSHSVIHCNLDNGVDTVTTAYAVNVTAAIGDCVIRFVHGVIHGVIGLFIATPYSTTAASHLSPQTGHQQDTLPADNMPQLHASQSQCLLRHKAQPTECPRQQDSFAHKQDKT